MWYFLILMLVVSSSATESFSSAASQLSRHKRSDNDSEPWKKRFLPNTIEPTFYHLYIDPYYVNNVTHFHGNVSIDVNVLNQTKTIIVHKKGITIRDKMVYYTNGTAMYITSHFDYPENDYHVIQTEKFLPAKARLFIAFNGSLTVGTDFTTASSGLYNMPYEETPGVVSWLVVSDFHRIKARWVFPCFDEPKFKTPFKLTVRHYKGWTAMSNMPMEKQEYPSSAAINTVFKVSPPMSTFFVGFVVTNFKYKSTTVDGKEYRVFAQPKSFDKVDYALNVTPTIVKYLQQELDMPYPIEKLDQIAVLGSLMSRRFEQKYRGNAGLVTYEESTLLANATNADHSARSRVLGFTIHALVHNYVDSLVTCRYWKELWLNEGLATFYEIRALTELDPTGLHKEYYFGRDIQYAYWTDEATEPDALIYPFGEYDALLRRYDFQRGNKGAAILAMMERFLGADVFKSCIRKYLKQNANGTVVTDNLWDVIQQEFGTSLDIKKVMLNWVTKKGLPVIKVELLSGNRINATQKQSFDLRVAYNIPNPTIKWYVPLTCQMKGGSEILVWMNETDVVFVHPERSSDDWILCNVNRTGYYRVNYEGAMWTLLAKQLNEDHTVFTQATRSSLFDDAILMVKQKELDFGVFLNLTRYAWKEKDSVPWFNINAGFVEFMIRINTTSFRRCEKYILNLTSDLMDRLQVKYEGSDIDKELRPLIITLACASGHRGCMENTTRAFRAWIENNQVEATASWDYLKAVYCAGMANSMDVSLWDATFEKYKSATSVTERDDLLEALCCTRNVTLIERLFDYFLNTTFAPDKDDSVMGHILYKPSLENIIWRWLKKNYEEIDRVMGSEFFERLLFYAARCMNTQAQYDEVLDFYNVYRNVTERTREDVKWVVEGNINWMKTYYNTLINWFDNSA